MSLTLPFRCLEASSMLAAYLVETRHLARVTPPELRPVEVFPGRAAVGIACIDYRYTSLGAYGEVGISWPVIKASEGPLSRIPALPLLFGERWPGLGWWVHRLPVTTEAAREAGVRIWGYPKTLASIEFTWNDAVRTCALGEQGESILSLTVDTRMTAAPQSFGQRTYTKKDGQLLGTEISFDGAGHSSFFSQAKLKTGPHPAGRELASWGLDGARTVNTQWFPVWRAVLPGPKAG